MEGGYTTYRLIVKKYIFVPVEGKLYRRTEILEEVITNSDVQTIDLTSESSEPSESSELLRCFNTPTYCECPEHRDYRPPSSTYRGSPHSL